MSPEMFPQRFTASAAARVFVGLLQSSSICCGVRRFLLVVGSDRLGRKRTFLLANFVAISSPRGPPALTALVTHNTVRNGNRPAPSFVVRASQLL